LLVTLLTAEKIIVFKNRLKPSKL